MTLGVMKGKTEGMEIAVSVLSESDKAWFGPIQGQATNYLWSKDAWEFTPNPRTNREIYDSLPYGGRFIVALAAEPTTIIGHRMKVNDRWYVDIVGNTEPKPLPVTGLVDGKYIIRNP